MNKDELLTTFNDTFSDLENSISQFDNKLFNQIPYKDSWTAGQVVEHISLAAGNFAKVLNGEVAPTERPVDEKVKILRSILLNFESKMKSPDFIDPQMKDYDKEQLLAQIQKIKHDIATAIPALDLNKTCLSFELPKLGHLTRLEAIYFVIFHTQRHLHQLKNIHQYLKLS